MTARCRVFELAVPAFTALALLAAGQSREPITGTVPTYAPGQCSISDIDTSLAEMVKTAPVHAAALLRARVAGCLDIISPYIRQLPPPPPAPKAIAHDLSGRPLPDLPTPTPVPTTPAACAVSTSNDPYRQYAILSYCSEWIAQNVPSPSPHPNVTFSPPALLVTGRTVPWTKVVYVLALGSDERTSAQIALQLTDDLRDCKYLVSNPGCDPRRQRVYPLDPYANLRVRYQVVAEPNWSLARYQEQCYDDASTAGAIVVLPPGIQSASYNVFFTAAWSALSLQAIVVDCEPTNSAYIHNTSYVTYITHVRTKVGHRYSLSLATVLGVVAGYLALHPARSTTYTYIPPSPLPSPGDAYPSSYQSNVAQGSTLAAVGSAALAPLSSTNIGQGAGPDVSAQIAGAMAGVLPRLLEDLMAPCPAVSANYQSPVFVATDPYATQCRWFHKP